MKGISNTNSHFVFQYHCACVMKGISNPKSHFVSVSWHIKSRILSQQDALGATVEGKLGQGGEKDSTQLCVASFVDRKSDCVERLLYNPPPSTLDSFIIHVIT